MITLFGKLKEHEHEITRFKSSEEECWNKMCLTLPPLSFDDNKVLKFQLDMLIFVQVCRTIVKKL